MTESREAFFEVNRRGPVSDALSPALEVCTILAVYSLPPEQAELTIHAHPMQHAINDRVENNRTMRSG